MDLLISYSLTNWVLIIIASFIIGLSKAGLKGIDMLNITIMALVFGGKASTGVVLPLLCVADVLAVIYYNRHATWTHFWKLIPWIAIGVLIGVFVGKDLDETVFRRIMAVIIVLTVTIMIILEVRETVILPTNKIFAIGMGLTTGFTTMIGNLASAYANIYFLAMRMPKNNFIGTVAWMFLIINFSKLPLQAFYWKNITAATLQTNLVLLPTLFLGFWTGLKIVAVLKDNSYRKLVILLTLIGAIVIFLK